MGYNKVINHAVRDSKKIIVPLVAVKDDLRKSLNVSEKKIVVTYEGVDSQISNSKPQVPNKYGKYFLYVGNAYPHKNLERLVQAFRIFKKNDNENVNLILVGKDDFFYKRLERNIKDDSIIFLHNVSDEELSLLYKNSIALVSVSLMEGFGLPAIEATFNDCLVMVSNISSFREVLGEGAIYLDPLNLDDIAKRMGEVLRNGRKHYLIQMSKAKDRLKLFSWQKMASETLEVYTSIGSV
jgi:glycosyltransferase involved in cell wall biosynthesis